MSVEQLSKQTYEEFAYKMMDRVKNNPTCEKCKIHPSVKINRWGSIKACCTYCLDEEIAAFNAARTESYCEGLYEDM